MSSVAQQSGLAANAIYRVPQSLIEISADAKAFLQGQLSCDINALSEHTSGLAAHCDAKGRVVAFFRVCLVAPQRYYLIMPASIRALALAQLNKYRLFSQAELTVREDLATLAFHGEAVKAQWLKHYSALPEQDYQQSVMGDKLVVCTSQALSSYEVYAPEASIAELIEQLDLPLDAASQHQLIQHQLGLAWIEAPISSTWLVHNLNYQLTPAVSFSKGCYTGQEIIARTQYRGQVKRRLYHYQVSAEQLAVGDSLNWQEQTVGGVISAVLVADKRWDCLLVLNDAATAATQLDSAHGAVSDLLAIALPYTD